MARHYQPKNNNPYLLEHDLYMKMFYTIRRYPKLLQRRESVLYGSPPPADGMPSGKGGTSNPTERKAVVLAQLDAEIEAIEQAIIYLKGKYSNTYTGEEFDPYEAFMDYGMFCYYRSRKDRDVAPHRNTWNRYRSEFAYLVAKKLNYF